ncbi:hypothetical protein WJN01_07115 [Flavobacteriaceae bacterium SZ-1-7]|uniref:hypothetical protein n=1 Tax=Tamlana sedimenti TaxID=3134126 RepID=UPI00312720E6
MPLSEIYFYMILIITQLLSFSIISGVEDLKEKKYFLRYLKIAIPISIIGILMELIGWNYLCDLQCVFICSVPIITLIFSKGIINLFKLIFKKEPFQMYRNELSDGIWIENKGDLANKFYYQFFSFTILIVPIIALVVIFKFLNDIMC